MRGLRFDILSAKPKAIDTLQLQEEEEQKKKMAALEVCLVF
jgi:hypothetical protein